ncbi:VWA domain-containing protein [Geoalkalibacter halelectricus]|uniref:VWA domain-containing protein n=1 Tax=Geoalkalibacter halelectricus TaxID=2847045 RepID=A0ABY5ZP82_9BACT|nr:VWA domain-containing protein [Geoalkalibacter halelectricus]MDO3379151.1 VWA domain-containing protein [Geoalkalibacter halelectricus]UWZ80911.1 VWA domain-containing protein [Geoalkalibacter halelectricus]
MSSTGRSGGVLRTVPAGQGGAHELAVGRTLRTAASRGAGQLRVRAEDVHRTIRRQRQETLVVFLVDASDSMGEGTTARIALAKGAVLSLLRRAYLSRDRVALITFRDQGAQVLLPPTRSGILARERLRRLAIGGATPLAAGFFSARRLIAQERRRDPGLGALLVVFSDGEANVPRVRGADLRREVLTEARALRHEQTTVVLFDTGARSRDNLLPDISTALNAPCHRLLTDKLDRLVQLIEEQMRR